VAVVFYLNFYIKLKETKSHYQTVYMLVTLINL